ncbi:hypothetical protein Tco_0682955 [Tanacetum coccineum]|uniref:Uncharacterized protein n=1 Tax=Tanacetum coccineum TaxID=301880 RepID=A0ABQ4XTQ8_9ASTR
MDMCFSTHNQCDLSANDTLETAGPLAVQAAPAPPPPLQIIHVLPALPRRPTILSRPGQAIHFGHPYRIHHNVIVAPPPLSSGSSSEYSSRSPSGSSSSTPSSPYIGPSHRRSRISYSSLETSHPSSLPPLFVTHPPKREIDASSRVPKDVHAETMVDFRLDDHNEMITEMYEHLLHIPLTSLETIEHELETLRARGVSSKKGDNYFFNEPLLGHAEQRDRLLLRIGYLSWKTDWGKSYLAAFFLVNEVVYVLPVLLPCDLDNSTDNVLIPLDSWTSGLLVYKSSLSVRMTKVIKGEFEKIKDVKVEDVPLTCDASLKVFNDKVSRLSKMDDDLFTYEVEVANIPCDSKMDNDSKQEADDDMGYDPGDDEVDVTDEESSDDEDDIAKVFRIDTDIYLITRYLSVQHLRNLTTFSNWKDNGYYNGGNLPGAYIIGNQLYYQGYEWYEALEDCKLKDEALRNKDIMEGSIKEDDDESRYEQKRQWSTYTNYDDAYEMNHEHNKSKELCEVHEQPVCNIRRYMMIKYLFKDDEEYVAVKEDEYKNLTVTRKEACRAYQ